jgi:hypothetical protein
MAAAWMAQWLLVTDSRSGDIVTLAKVALAMNTVDDLAKLLGVDAEQVTGWELNQQPLEPMARRLLALLMLDVLTNAVATRRDLEALASSPPLPKSTHGDLTHGDLTHFIDPRIASARRAAAALSDNYLIAGRLLALPEYTQEHREHAVMVVQATYLGERELSVAYMIKTRIEAASERVRAARDKLTVSGDDARSAADAEIREQAAQGYEFLSRLPRSNESQSHGIDFAQLCKDPLVPLQVKEAALIFSELRAVGPDLFERLSNTDTAFEQICRAIQAKAVSKKGGDPRAKFWAPYYSLVKALWPGAPDVDNLKKLFPRRAQALPSSRAKSIKSKLKKSRKFK